MHLNRKFLQMYLFLLQGDTSSVTLLELRNEDLSSEEVTTDSAIEQAWENYTLETIEGLFELSQQA